MRIEEFWQDVSIYLVDFETEKKKQIQKYIVLDHLQTICEIEEIIKASFGDVTKIISIDEITAMGLRLKEMGN